MKSMDKNELMDQLAQHGYALMRPKSREPVEKLLENLLRQEDARFLEGFPVVFALALKEKTKLAWESAAWNPSREFSKKNERRLGVLFVMTDLLLKLFGLAREHHASRRALHLALKCKGVLELLPQLADLFNKSQTVKVDHLELSTERLKNNFRNYVVHREESGEVLKKRQALEFELLLSQLFTARQKELLKKKLEAKPMTKTEREYFCRVVNKRLKALANEELHQMARSLTVK